MHLPFPLRIQAQVFILSALLCAGHVRAQGNTGTVAAPSLTETSREAVAEAPARIPASLWGGQPTMVVELEREKSAQADERGNALTLYPGLRWKDGWIHQLEFRLSHEREKETEAGQTRRSTNRDLAIRIRRNFPIHGDLGGFVRVLAGHKNKGDNRFPFGYGELALTYPVQAVELYAGYRFVRALDNTPEQDFNQLRIGAGFEMTPQHELEFRVARAWDRGTGLRRSDAAEIEMTWKF